MKVLSEGNQVISESSINSSRIESRSSKLITEGKIRYIHELMNKLSDKLSIPDYHKDNFIDLVVDRASDYHRKYGYVKLPKSIMDKYGLYYDTTYHDLLLDDRYSDDQIINILNDLYNVVKVSMKHLFPDPVNDSEVATTEGKIESLKDDIGDLLNKIYTGLIHEVDAYGSVNTLVNKLRAAGNYDTEANEIEKAFKTLLDVIKSIMGNKYKGKLEAKVDRVLEKLSKVSANKRSEPWMTRK